METFQGTSLMWMEKFDQPDVIIASDACLLGAGGTFTPEVQSTLTVPHFTEFYQTRFPSHIADGASIAVLEMWALIITLKLWGDRLTRKTVVVNCDNEAVVHLINSGKAKDLMLQAGLREICLIAATEQFELLAKFLPGNQNRIPDLLSRWDNGENYRKQFRQLAGSAVRRTVRDSLFYFTHNW